jgi:NADPH-dependent 2,4-dienoyl-CoA reductase/sulfur reductase-like enzyme
MARAERVVVIGGDAAGMSAASQARRLEGPDRLAITAFEKGRFTSYSACGIPYWVAGMIEERDRLIARSPEVFRAKQDIDVRTRHEVLAIDTDAGTVTVRDLDAGREFDEPYDQLLVATGAAPVRPPIDGIDASGVFGIQTLTDGQRVLDALTDRSPRTAVVIGGGYIGLEMAEAMKLRGLEVHLVEMASQPMSTIDEGLGERIADAMRTMGITLHLGVPVDAVEADDDGWVTAVCTGDERIEADLVVLGIGARPFSDLARDAGIPVGPSGGIVTDRRQRTPVEGVWAAGDCAQTFHRVSQRPVSIALGTIANKQGRVAGLNLGGSYATFPGVLGTAVTKVCEVEIARTGLGEQEARDAGFEVVTASIDATTRAGYYPGAKPIAIKINAERDSGRLLGAQIVGQEGAAKRIDVLATALWNDMTVGDLLNVDLSYAPPFSPVWDPVLIAARKADSAVVAARG